MSEFGEWTRKGAVLSEVSAQTEYGVTRDFIIEGINSGELEYREGSGWGNPYLRLLRSQLEARITTQLGAAYLTDKKSQTEMRAVNKQIAELKRKLSALEARKAEITRLGSRSTDRKVALKRG